MRFVTYLSQKWWDEIAEKIGEDPYHRHEDEDS